MKDFSIDEIKFSQLPADLKAKAIHATLNRRWDDYNENLDFLAYCIDKDVRVFGMFSLGSSDEGWDFWEKALSGVCENIKLLDKVGLN